MMAMYHSKSGILNRLPILLVDLHPKFLHLLQTIREQGLSEASTISEAPLQVVIDGQGSLYEHLTSSVESDKDQHPLSARLRSCSCTGDHHIDVDHQVCQETVIE